MPPLLKSAERGIDSYACFPSLPLADPLLSLPLAAIARGDEEACWQLLNVQRVSR